jgi:hypothetical protein
MAKALFGHIAVAPDRRLVDELTYLRTRVRSLEDEVTRLRAEREDVPGLSSGAIDSDLRDLSEISEPALA